MKVKNLLTKSLASKEFTDREIPRESFWKHFNQRSENINNNDIHVLTYYGIGGKEPPTRLDIDGVMLYSLVSLKY